MTKADLVERMASEAGITKAAAERALKCVTNSIQGCIKRNTFRRKARTGRNPRTGQTINIPAKTVPKFSPAKELVDAARGF